MCCQETGSGLNKKTTQAWGETVWDPAQKTGLKQGSMMAGSEEANLPAIYYSLVLCYKYLLSEI